MTEMDGLYTLDILIREVTAWHVDHFGRQPMHGPLARKLVEEAGEFAEWAEIGQEDIALDEAADVLIVLCAWAGRHDLDLLGAARKKLAIVKERDQIARDKERGIIPADFIKGTTP